MHDHAAWQTAMGEALEEARAAGVAGDVPVGAVVVLDGAVIGRGRNRRVADDDPLAHAEVEALRAASASLGRWRLDDATLVSTLEPCPMCAGAALQARIGGIVFGAPDPRAGACGSLYNLPADPRLPHGCEVVAGVEAAAAAELLGAFFAERRGDPGDRP